MQAYRFFGVALLAAAISGSAQTTPSGNRALALDECFQIALQHNLDVQIQRINPEIARYNLSMAYGGYDPTFNFSANQSYARSEQGRSLSVFQPPANESWTEMFSAGIGGKLPTGTLYDVGGDVRRNSGFASDNTGVLRDVGFNYSAGIAINLTQPLLKNGWIDQTRMTIQINKKTLKTTDLALAYQIMNTLTLVEQAYYDLIFARENVKVQQQALQLADRLLAENKKRVEVGAMAPLDEKQAESQAAVSRSDLLSSQNLLSVAQNALKRQLSDEFNQWQDVNVDPTVKLTAIPLAFNRGDSWQKGLTQRPDLQQMRIDLEKQDIQLRYARNQMYPQLDLKGSYGRNGVAAQFGGTLDDIAVARNPNFSFGGVMSIPIGNRSARNNVKIIRAQKQQSLLQLKKFEQDIMVQIDDAVNQARTSLERVEATRQARAYAEAALNAEQKKLENGKSTSFVVLSLQRNLTSARSEEIRALTEYNRALAQLALAEGSTLDRNRIKLEIK